MRIIMAMMTVLGLDHDEESVEKETAPSEDTNIE
jgi:hypothetical protein